MVSDFGAGEVLELESLSHRIIACAIAVHSELGPGFMESIYETALTHKAGHLS